MARGWRKLARFGAEMARFGARMAQTWRVAGAFWREMARFGALRRGAGMAGDAQKASVFKGMPNPRALGPSLGESIGANILQNRHWRGGLFRGRDRSFGR